MRTRAPFTPADLVELDERLLAPARRVVPMFDVFKGDRADDVIGLRHDVDDNVGSFDAALALAEWENSRGYSSTFFLLHGAHYWTSANLALAPRFVELGHEVGIHVNAIAVALAEDGDPQQILFDALAELREFVPVRGAVAHGDALCHSARFVNDEMFAESRRPDYGAGDRFLKHGSTLIALEPVPRSVFGIEYDANWLPRSAYLSDSGGRWSRPFDDVVERELDGQLHVLIHPDWWTEAFDRVAA